jgi:short subunit dehydrogenase-like uncharacterized protein
LIDAGQTVVLAGRDAARLASTASGLGGVDVISGSFDSLLTQMRIAAPAVVVNTIGPFARTSATVIEACPPGTHYVDIGNEFQGTLAVLDGHERAVATDRTVVTGAGFGVLATESVVFRVCEGRPAPARVRVDAIPSLATEKASSATPSPAACSTALPTVDGGSSTDASSGSRSPAPPRC